MAESETSNRRTVVLAVDASKHSERAFYWYIKNVWDKEKDFVLLIHAQEYPTIPTAAYPYGYYGSANEWQRMMDRSDREVKELMEAYGNKCKQEEVKFKLYKEENKRPGEVICKLAEGKNAQFIVMGSRGMGTLRRTFLGSVSDYCVHHAHIPVVIIPPPNRHGNHAHSS